MIFYSPVPHVSDNISVLGESCEIFIFIGIYPF